MMGRPNDSLIASAFTELLNLARKISFFFLFFIVKFYI